MRKSIMLIGLCFCLSAYSQTGKIFFELNYNTFSHTSLKQFQEEFREDLSDIPVKTLDNFPSNIGYTLGYEIIDANISVFLSYNATGSKLSYSDYSGIIRLEQHLNAFTFGGIYNVNLNSKNFNLGLKGFSMLSNLDLNSYTEINTNIQVDELGFNSVDFGIGAQLNYEYPLPFLILKAHIGYDVVLGSKLKFKENSEAHLINNNDEDVNTGWSGLRTGIGIAFNIN